MARDPSSFGRIARAALKPKLKYGTAGYWRKRALRAENRIKSMLGRIREKYDERFDG